MHFKEAKGILSPHNGMNIYRGCTHGCIYCDSRSRCYHMEHDFEDVQVKSNAPELLEDALRRRRTRCMIGTGAMCDPYMHCETELGYTRRCLEIIARHGFGLAIHTKSARILRDLDLLKQINRQAKCVVQFTLTAHDADLCRVLEPKVSDTAERVEALHILRENGIPTVVWLCPVLPFLTDTEENIRALAQDCAGAGVHGIITFGMGMTLREGNREYYYQKLDEHFPGLKQKYIQTYGVQYSLHSEKHPALMKLLHEESDKAKMLCGTDNVFAYLQELEADTQLRLF